MGRRILHEKYKILPPARHCKTNFRGPGGRNGGGDGRWLGRADEAGVFDAVLADGADAADAADAGARGAATQRARARVDLRAARGARAAPLARARCFRG